MGESSGPLDEISRDSGRRNRGDFKPTGVARETGLLPTLKRTFKEFSEDNMSDWAASLTYYGLLSLFPALIALVSIIGLFGNPASTTKTLTDIVNGISPGTGKNFQGPIKSITQERGAAGILFVVGLVLALNSASGYIAAFTRAANIIYETPEGRPIWKLKPQQIGIAFVMVIAIAFLALGLVLTGPVVAAVAGPIGVGSTAQTIWNIAKWPVMVLVFVFMINVLFAATPNVRLPGFKWAAPGALMALVVWVIASALFAFYIANFSSYDKTYGTLGGVVALLVWFWITNSVLLLGMELNSERERSREMDAGIAGAEREIQLDARDEPKDKQTT